MEQEKTIQEIFRDFSGNETICQAKILKIDLYKL